MTTSGPNVTLIDNLCLQGRYMKSFKGNKICAFQGIPYAKPPVGALRFKAPDPVVEWEGCLDATKEGNACLQIDFVTFQRIGSEDCLYLNVYAPEAKEDRLFDVMVWVHGGGLTSGTGNTDLYGPEFLLDHNVVLVTFNYRLGFLGFLSMETCELSGNYGLKDQVCALKWVQKNISKFGGNPNSVTIFGESAGAACVNYLLLSPLTKGLFHKAIVQSGSAFADWAFQRDAKEKAMNFAQNICPGEHNVDKIISALRKTDVQTLFDRQLELLIENPGKYNIFAPAIEPADTKEAFLTEDPQLLLERGEIANVPIMAGITTHEGYIKYGKLFKAGGNIQDDLLKNFKSYVPENLNISSSQINSVWDKILKFYQGFEANDDIVQYVHLHSDIVISNGVDLLVRKVAALTRNPVYYYLMTYVGGRALLKNIMGIEHKGVNHADDLGYLFERKVIPIENNSASDIQTMQNMTTLWTNFAKTGNPTPDNALQCIWKPVKAELNKPNSVETYYLDIGDELSMKLETLNKERVNFWRQLYNEFGVKYYKLKNI